MGMTLIQAGTSLQMVDTSGNITTLTLPTGINLRSDVVPRFALYGRYTILVNTPNRPISIDPTGVVRPLTPFPPSTKLTLATSGAGALTGDYKAKQTYVIRDDYGNIIAESDFGPAMPTAVTAAANKLVASGINISKDAVTGSNLYRTTAGGAVYFLWREQDGNVQTSSEADDLADLSLGIFAAPTLGTVPDLTLVTEWRGRLWGVPRVDVDDVAYTEAGLMYSWPADNRISIPKIGADARGIVGFITRKEALIVGKRNNIQQITGTGDRDFRAVKLSDQIGIESNESIATYKDMTFFIWKDGVYVVDSAGVRCISDGKVRTWFTKDDTFNRAMFQYAVGIVDPVRMKYRLFLAAAGSSVLDRWVEYDIEDGTWWGPHKTAAFTPVSGIVIPDSNDQLLPMIGSSSGFLYQEQATATDGTSDGIEYDVITGWNNNGDPSLVHFWGRLIMQGRVQTTGNLQVTPRLGYVDAPEGNSQYYQMSKGSEVLGRLGQGELLKLRFRHSTAGEPVELLGFQVEDVHPVGDMR